MTYNLKMLYLNMAYVYAKSQARAFTGKDEHIRQK